MRLFLVASHIATTAGAALRIRATCTQTLLASMMGDMVMPPVPMIPSHIPSGCSDFEVLIARGGSEENAPNGKFGAFFGDPLMGNITSIIPGARGYPVQYPASSNLDKDVLTGSKDTIDRLRKQAKECPNQKFALVGLSAGGMVIHHAAVNVPADLMPKILAISLYGSPTMACPEDYGKISNTLSKRLQEVCSKGDNTCDKTGQCHDRHMDYVKQAWISRGVDFIIAAFSGKAMPADIGKAVMLESPDIAKQICNNGIHEMHDMH